MLMRTQSLFGQIEQRIDRFAIFAQLKMQAGSLFGNRSNFSYRLSFFNPIALADQQSSIAGIGGKESIIVLDNQ